MISFVLNNVCASVRAPQSDTFATLRGPAFKCHSWNLKDRFPREKRRPQKACFFISGSRDGDVPSVAQLTGAAGVTSEGVLQRKLFCFGLGYTALGLISTLQKQGWEVAGTCREPEKQEVLQARGIKAYLYNDETLLDSFNQALVGTTHVLVSIPPAGESDMVVDSYQYNLLDLYFGEDDDLDTYGSLKWVGYLSATGVYGDRGGGWVDESSPLNPSTPRAVRRKAAEKKWLRMHQIHSFPLHIFRLAGIYGPYRNVLEAIKRGEPPPKRIDKPGQVFSRIHVADTVQTLMASMNKPNPGSIYNVCDDEAVPPHEVIEYACKLAGVPPPAAIPLSDAAGQVSDARMSFYTESKRVSNDRIKQELGVKLLFPTYREGLDALFAGDQRPFD